jgi:large subunit ribosomal protein L19
MIPEEILRKIKSGATIRVFETSHDGDKARMSKFEGLVLSRKHGSESGASFTVRQTIAGVGVEKVYPVHAPIIAKVEILSSPKKVSRSKLYYLRTRSRKEVRQQTQIVPEKTAA